MKKKLSIPFKLVNIEETQFSVFEEVLGIDSPINQNIGVGFSVDREERIVGTTLRFQLNKEEQPFIKIEATCYFEIEETSFKEKLLKEKEVILPCEFAKHLATITTGTVRGILYANTKNTPFNVYFLSLINIEEMFKEDVVLDS